MSSTHQEYWDACLIKAWRNHGNLLDAIMMFKSITGEMMYEVTPPLLRTPPVGTPWKLPARAYMAQRLEKISDRLWDQPPEKDVALLKKLQTSSYTTSTANTNTDNAMERERSQYLRNRKKVGMSTLNASNQNQATDWNIVKGPARVRAKRR